MADEYDEDFDDESMMDLFKEELENHTALLNEGLSKLENSPGTDEMYKDLMRSAHSIKGAARIVEMESIAKLSKGIEDYFLAAQEKKVDWNIKDIQILQKGANLLSDFINNSIKDIENWPATHEKEVGAMTLSVVSIL